MKNEYTDLGNGSTIMLVRSKKYGDYEVWVDTEDVERMSQIRWCLNPQGAQKALYIRGSRPQVLLHRFILNREGSEIVDHKNRNIRDNRKSNLRVATRTMNQANSTRGRKIAKYKGVMVEKRFVTTKYRAALQCHGKTYYSKSFLTEVEAAQAYNLMAIEHFGEFAHLNIVDPADSN